MNERSQTCAYRNSYDLPNVIAFPEHFVHKFSHHRFANVFLHLSFRRTIWPIYHLTYGKRHRVHYLVMDARGRLPSTQEARVALGYRRVRLLRLFRA